MAEGKPVIIVGAGPVGLSLAVALHHKGIPFVVYEALAELSTEARASTFHPPTLEMFAEWGVIDEVLRCGHRVDKLQFWERSTLEMIAEFDYSHIQGDTPYPFRLQCPQSALIRILKAYLDVHAPDHVFMNHRCISFTQDECGVAVTLETPQGVIVREGSFLCAADGSKSVIRKQLGIAYEGMTYADRFLLVACDLDVRQIFPMMGSVSYLFDPLEWVILMQLPDVTRVVFQLSDEEDEAEACAEPSVRARVHRLAGRAVPFVIHHVSTYSVHQRVAETFHVGRVLLLGDAAHINNPMGGMGMNSGIHDAHCLAEQLARVWYSSDDAALEVYNAARRAYSLQSVRLRTHQNYEDMAADEGAYRAARNQRFREIAADPTKQRAYLLKSSMLDDRIPPTMR